jgi:outer membrane protein
MKKTILGVIAAIFTFSGTVSAQQKIGHINNASIIQAMPEYKQMITDLEKKQDEYAKVYQGMMAEYEKKSKEYQALANDKSASDPIIDVKFQEVMDLQKRIGDFETKMESDLQKLQGDKYKPIQEKYTKAVKEVATANGFAYILDVISLVYFPEGSNDVTDLVMKKLGVTAAPAPAGGK